MSSRRSLRSGHGRRTPTRAQMTQDAGVGACIDLTVDYGGDEVIDLTHNSNSIMDSPVVVISAADDVGPIRRQRGSGRQGRRRFTVHGSPTRISQFSSVSSSSLNTPTPSSSRAGRIPVDDNDDELPDLPFVIPKESSIANASYCKSPPLQIQCPVCLDDLKQIKASKKRVMSTTCGHIFCEECIVNAVKAYKSCPTCRKHLVHSKIHPLFL